MKRRLVNIGVFARAICSGIPLAGKSELLVVYELLKSMGFRETRWQLIYDHQIAGLVCPYNNGLNEIHIRFYEDRVFSELEFSRSSILHFFIPQYNANQFILDLIGPKLSTSVRRTLVKAMSNNLREDERCKLVWNYESFQNPYLSLFRRNNSIRNTFFLHKILSWRALIVLNVFLSSLVLPSGSPLLTALFGLSLISIPFIPTVGKP